MSASSNKSEVEIIEHPQNTEAKRLFASPLAKRLAYKSGIDLISISGTGPHGRIIKVDIESAVKNLPSTIENSEKQENRRGSALPVTSSRGSSYTEIPNTNIRKIIADRLTVSSRDIPTYTVTIDCNLDNLLNLRLQLNEKSPEDENKFKISINDFVIRAVALSIRRFPKINSSWTDEATIQYENINISVAVATSDGLITPIIHDADQKGLAEISTEMKELALRGKDNKLLPHEFQGGGFTISNLGMYGVKEFSSIINPPQSCILSVGAAEERAVVYNGALGIATIMSCTMASDHRTVDGALAAKFLQDFKEFIEDPITMLL